MYNCCVSLLYVYIDVYTLQVCIIDLTHRGCHTLRIAVVLFGCDTVKFGRRLRTSRCLHGAWTYVHHAVLVVREVCELYIFGKFWPPQFE